MVSVWLNIGMNVLKDLESHTKVREEIETIDIVKRKINIMEFQGRIAKVLPMRSGTSQRTGNEWKSLPFVFEYFEHDTDRYADSVLLETFDTKVIENLKEGMEVICGFSHKAKDLTKQDGTKTTINELRLYKIESIRKQSSAPAPAPQPAAPVQQPVNQQGNGDDDLPF